MNEPLFWLGFAILLVVVPASMYWFRGREAVIPIITYIEFLMLAVGMFLVWYLLYYKP